MINPASISFEEIKRDLQEYIQELSKTDNSWRDFFETSTGEIILELLAGFGSFLLYKTYVARREAYLPEAMLLSSSISISQGLGYSVYRGVPPKLILNVGSDGQFSLPKYSIIGSCKDYDIILAEDLVLNGGDSATVTAYIGKVVSETKTLTISSDSTYVYFRYTQPVTEIVELFINGTVTEISTAIKDLTDKWVGLTNKYLSLDLYNLNISGAYKNGDSVELKGINYDFSYQPNLSDIKLYYSQFTISQLIPAVPPIDVEAIKLFAPLYADTNNIVRAREDYKKLLLFNFPYLRDAVTHDDASNPGIVYVSYIKQDLTLLTDTERSEILTFLDQLRPMGIPLPQIVDPIEIDTTLSVSVKLKYPVADSLIRQVVSDAVEKHSKWLGQDLDLYAIENEIEQNDFVTVARITVDSSYTIDWNSYIRVTDFTITYL